MTRLIYLYYIYISVYLENVSLKRNVYKKKIKSLKSNIYTRQFLFYIELAKKIPEVALKTNK